MIGGVAAPFLAVVLFLPWAPEGAHYDDFDRYRIIASPAIAFAFSWLVCVTAVGIGLAHNARREQKRSCAGEQERAQREN